MNIDPLIPDYKAVAARLYQALHSMPCRCTKRWERSELVTVSECGRCLALQSYEAIREVA